MSTEIALIQKTLDGETGAFGQLVVQYQQQIYRLIYRIIGNAADAQDIAQEVFIKAYQNLETLKDPRCFQAWLMKIARNSCYNWIRQRQDNLFSLDQEMIEYHTMQFPPAPDEVIIKEELYERVMSAISELPEKDKKVIELFYLEEKSYQEIQQQLGISKSVLGWRLSNARAKLRQKLQTAYYGIAPWCNFQWKRITELANVKISSMSAAKFFFISLALHLAVVMTVPNVYHGKGNNQNYRDAHEGGFVTAGLLSSANQEADQLDSYPVSVGQAGQNNFRAGATKSELIATYINPIEQPLPELTNIPLRQPDNTPRLKLLVQNETSLSFDVVAVMESSGNEDVIENISHNKPAQFLQRMEKGSVGQRFQSQTDLLAFMDVNAQAATSSKNDISSAESELEENPTRILKGHKDAVTRIAFSPDGQLLASSSRDSTIRLWDIATGEFSILSGHKDAVGKVAFSPDGKWLVSSSSWAKEVFLWNVSEKRITKFLARRSANDLSFSPDGKLLAVLSGSKVLFWDITTQRRFDQIDDAYKHYILLETISARYGTALDFSPDGKILAVGSMMGTVDLWNLAERELLLTLAGPTTGPGQGIWKVQFSPDGKSLAASYIEGNVNLWDLETGQLKYSFIAFQKHAGGVVFSPDSFLLASGRNPVKLWDVSTGQIVKRFKGSQPIAFSPDGKWFACSFKNNAIALWDLSSEYQEILQRGNLSQTESDTSSQIAFISDRGADTEILNRIYLMDADGSNQIILANPPENTRSIGGVAVSPNGQKIAFHATDSSGNVDIWVMDADGQNPKQLTFGREVDSSPSWSPDGKMIAFESGVPEKMDVCVMNADDTNYVLERSEGIVKLTNNGAENIEPAWSPDGKKIAFSSNHGEREKVYNIYIVDVESGKLLKLTHNAGMRQQSRQPAWSPNGKHLAYVSGKYMSFTSSRPREWWRQRASALFIMNADGKNQRKLIDGAIHPVWSKDGKQIIFAADMDRDDEIYAIDLDGNILTNLTQNNKKDSEPDLFVSTSE
ncbi:sigma-70 family RNA polymerase sigma factor [bacterium]|nr:sigma-70 family RNA polymerase sigma factor [bacterium]